MRTPDAASIVVAIKDCFAIDIWEQDFYEPFKSCGDPEELIWGYNSHETVYRATLCFSLISLRKMADFLENKKKRRDDITISDFGMDFKALTGQETLIDDRMREKVNKTIAHLTHLGEANNEDLEELRAELERCRPTLEKLADIFFDKIKV